MVKEVFDNGEYKMGKKPGEGIYSEEAGNLLNENTPEGKYITDIELRIKEVKEKIKSNKKSLTGVKKRLPSYEKERKMRREMIEKFSEFLAEEELEIVKKGRTFLELDEIVKGKTVDPFSDLIEKICEGIKNFSDEEKFILADYLVQKKILMLNMDSSIVKDSNIDYYQTLRGVGDYYTDFGEIIYMVHEIQKNINKGARTLE